MPNTQPERRVELTIRVPEALKARVVDYARRRGISLNAAGNIVLDEGLSAEDRRLGTTDSAPRARGKKQP